MFSVTPSRDFDSKNNIAFNFINGNGFLITQFNKFSNVYLQSQLYIVRNSVLFSVNANASSLIDKLITNIRANRSDYIQRL